MGEKTLISWADATWNPWQGCTKVSPGCENCYMYRDRGRYGFDPAVVVRSSPRTFNGPLSQKRWPRDTRVFVCSWSDFFHPAADSWRPEAWDIIYHRTDLTFLILTKRPERIEKCLPPNWHYVWQNVWLGVTAENQEQADRRIPILLRVPTFHRFVSCEPLLGPVDLDPYLGPSLESWDYERGGRSPRDPPHTWAHGLEWIIVGGESGPDARPMDPAWARSLREQAIDTAVPFFYKQDGGIHGGGDQLDGRTWRQVPTSMRMRT